MPSWWESEYVLGQGGVTVPPRIGHAVVRALVPGGLTQILTRQALRVIRGSSPIVRKRSIVRGTSPTVRKGSVENVTKSLSPSSKSPSKK